MRRDRMKSSSKVSVFIFSNNSRRMAKSSPAAPTAEYNRASNALRVDSYFQYIPSPPEAALSLVCMAIRFSPATHPTLGSVKAYTISRKASVFKWVLASVNTTSGVFTNSIPRLRAAVLPWRSGWWRTVACGQRARYSLV